MQLSQRSAGSRCSRHREGTKCSSGADHCGTRLTRHEQCHGVAWSGARNCCSSRKITWRSLQCAGARRSRLQTPTTLTGIGCLEGTRRGSFHDALVPLEFVPETSLSPWTMKDADFTMVLLPVAPTHQRLGKKAPARVLFGQFLPQEKEDQTKCEERERERQ